MHGQNWTVVMKYVITSMIAGSLQAAIFEASHTYQRKASGG